MNPRIKQLWLDTLRSGDYTQGSGALRAPSLVSNADQYCCLGVLCDLHAKETNSRWDSQALGSYYLGSSSYLPEEVAEWAELKSHPRLQRAPNTSDVCYDINIDQTSGHTLSSYNDTGATFADIALAIEEHL